MQTINPAIRVFSISDQEAPGALNFSLCINTGGKLRMLSHRYCLFLTQGKDHEPQAKATLRTFDDTLAELLAESGRIDAPSSAPGKALGPGFSRVQALIALFSEKAWHLISGPVEGFDQGSMLTELSDLTTGPLLDGLNQLVASFQLNLETRERRRESKLVELLDQLDDLSDRVKLLSINARIVSARAGAVGRVYNVINQELQALSEESQAASGGLRSIHFHSGS